jgi:ECF transporter S component (folate family)
MKGGFFMEKTRRNTWTASASELRRLKVLTACGMMCALALVLNMTTTFNIGPYIRIGVSGIPAQVVDYLFGPVVGGIFGGVLDIVKYVLRPDGNFFPGFTISGIVGGMIYGAILYRQRPTVLRILAAQAAVWLRSSLEADMPHLRFSLLRFEIRNNLNNW